jgi:hypothetical protein
MRVDTQYGLSGMAGVGRCKDILAPFLRRLEQTYADMDLKYRNASDFYGFLCKGCEDNCCRTRFYHHTVVEYRFLLKGFQGLERQAREKIRHRALQVCREAAAADKTGAPVRQMCPLNVRGRCCLYAYRPMICRLHGIAHEIRHPAKGLIHSPGCEAFTAQCRDKGYLPFDRTPIYMALAKIESEFKQAAGVGQKFKMTVAEMLVSPEEWPRTPDPGGGES